MMKNIVHLHGGEPVNYIYSKTSREKSKQKKDFISEECI